MKKQVIQTNMFLKKIKDNLIFYQNTFLQEKIYLFNVRETKKRKDAKTKEAVFDFLKFISFFMFTLIYKIDKANVEWIQQTILCSTDLRFLANLRAEAVLILPARVF